MPKRRKCTLKNLPTRQCKKPKISVSLRQKRGMVNYDDSKYDVLDFVDESDNLSETIEISSEDSKEKEVTPVNDCESNDSSDVVIIENKDSLFESMVSTFKDTTFIDVSVENNVETQKSDNCVADIQKSNTESEKSNNVSSAVSLSSSETKSSSSNKRKKKSQKIRETTPIVPPVSEEIFYVEKILDMKTVNGKKMFLLKWEGFPDSENTWEPEENIQTNVMVQDFLNNMKNINKIQSNDNESLKSEKSNKPSGIDVDSDTKSSPKDAHEKHESNDTILTNGGSGDQKGNVSPISIGTYIGNNLKELITDKDLELDDTIVLESDSEKRVTSDDPNDTDVKENHEHQAQKTEHKISTFEESGKASDAMEGQQAVTVENDTTEPSAPIAPPKARARPNRRSREEMNLIRDLDSSFWDLNESRSGRRRRRLMSLTEILNQPDDRSPSSDTGDRIRTRSNYSASIHDDQKTSEVSSNHRSRNNSQTSHGNNSTKQNNQDDQVSVSGGPDTLVQQGVKDPNSYFPGNMPQTVQEIFMVEKILKMKVFNGVRKFFLKWEGFPDSENTWEPEENLECPELIKEFLKQKRIKQKLKKRKKLMTVSEDPLVLEELPDEVVIKEPVVKPRGFPRSREAESILAAGILNDQLMFLIKWKNVDMANLVSARRANLECPQVVIRYYESHLNWQNGDDTITKAPKEPIFRNVPGDAARQAILATKKQSGFDQSVDAILSRLASNKVGPSPVKMSKLPKIPKPAHSLANRFMSPLRRVRKPRQKKLLESAQSLPGLLQARPGSDRSSVSMMNLIRNFKDRKPEPPQSQRQSVPPALGVRPAAVPRATALDSTRNAPPPPLVGGTCQYESRDMPREATPPPPRFDPPAKVSTAPLLRNINSFRGDMASTARRMVAPLARPSLSTAPPLSTMGSIASSTGSGRPPVMIQYLQATGATAPAPASIASGSVSAPIIDYVGAASLLSASSFSPLQRQMSSSQIRPCLPGGAAAGLPGVQGTLHQMHALTSSIGSTAPGIGGLSQYGGTGAFPIQAQCGVDTKNASRMQLAAAIQSRYQSALSQQQQQSMVLMHHPNLIQSATDPSQLIIYQGTPQQPAQYQYVINQSSTPLQSTWQQPTDFYSQQQQCLMMPNIDSLGSYTLPADLGQHLLHQASSQPTYVSQTAQQQHPQQQQQPLMKQDPPDRLQNSFMNLRAFL